MVAPDLPAFLRARLDEDASDMAAAQPMPGQNSRLATMQGTTILMSATRALAEIDAKRHIIDEHPILTAWKICTRCSDFHNTEPINKIPGPCLTLRLLALPYASHPDYQKTWAP